MSEFGMEVKAAVRLPIYIYWNIHDDLVIKWKDEAGRTQAAVVKAENIGEKTTSKRRRRT